MYPCATPFILLALLSILPERADAQQNLRAHFTHNAGAKHSKTEEIRKAQEYLKNWPEPLRSALFAEYDELLFTDDGSSPYLNGGAKRTWEGEIAPGRDTSDQAKYLGLDGQVHPWCITVRSKTPERSQEWRDIKNAVAKYGEKAVLATYAQDRTLLKKLFANRNKGTAIIQRIITEQQNKQAQQSPVSKKEAREAAAILKAMEKMEPESRRAVLACLRKDISPMDALNHCYADSEGKMCCVYEQLHGGDCVNEALDILARAAQEDEIGQKVLSKLEKGNKAMERGEKLRSLYLEATQKQYEAALAKIEAEIAARSGEPDEEATLKATVASIENVQDRLCRAALIRIAAEHMNVEQLFSEIVQDSWHVPHSCYDVLSQADMLENAIKLMSEVETHAGLGDAVASRFSSEIASMEKEREKRGTLINLASKQYEAEAARKNLRELEQN